MNVLISGKILEDIKMMMFKGKLKFNHVYARIRLTWNFLFFEVNNLTLRF